MHLGRLLRERRRGELPAVSTLHGRDSSGAGARNASPAPTGPVATMSESPGRATDDQCRQGDLPTDRIDSDGVKAVDDWLSAELTLAHQKKHSLETRGIAIVTITGALAAIYVAIQGQLDRVTTTAESQASVLTQPGLATTALTIGLVGAAVAVIAAALATSTFLLREPDASLFETELKRALHPTTVPIRAYLVTGKITELQSISRANDFKGACLAISFAGLAIYALSLIVGVALPIASLSR